MHKLKSPLTYLTFTLFFLFFFLNLASAESTLIWGQSSDPSPSFDYHEAYAIAVDSTGVYVAGVENTSSPQWRIEKRDINNGALIPAFDGDGVITANPGSYLSAIAVDGTGLYLAGCQNGVGWRIEKRDPITGVLISPDFDGDGIVTTNPNAYCAGGVVGDTGHSKAISITIDSDSIYIGGVETIPWPGFGAFWRIEKRNKTTGALDLSFDTDGILTIDPTTAYDYLRAIAVDGTAIYLAGSEYYDRWHIEKRDKTTGSPMWTPQISDPTTDNDLAYSIAIDTTGVYIAGIQRPGPSNNIEWRIEKRDLTNGSLIWVQTEAISPCYWDDAYAITLDSTGLYVAGYDSATADDNDEWRVEKRDKANGNIIWVQSTNIADNWGEAAYAITVDSTGVYVAGHTIISGGNDTVWRIEKRSLDGTPPSPPPPPSSGGAIIWEKNNPTSSTTAYSLTIDGSSIFVSGSPNLLEKRDKITGERDLTFGGSGALTTTVNMDYLGNRITVDSSSVYLTGYYVSSPPSFWDWQWGVEKRDKTTGALIWFQASNPTVADWQYEQPYAIAVDSTGVYAAGYDQPVLGNYRWRIEKRDLTTGNLDLSFGSGGVVTSDPSPFTDDRAYAIAVDATSIYIAGVDRFLVSDQQWRIEKRDRTTGALDPSFDFDGVVISNPTSSTNPETPYAIAIDSTAIYIAGTSDDGTGGSYTNQWRIEKRDKITGLLDTSFGSFGVLSINPTLERDEARTITVDSTAIYIAGYFELPGEYGVQWRVEKRDINNGSLLWSQTYNSNLCRSDSANAIAVDPTGLSPGVYAAGQSGFGSYQWRIEKRSLNGGSSFIDCGFRVFDGTSTVTIACEPLGTPTSPLRISKGGNIYGIALVDTTDTNASRVRIQTSTGVKSLRRYP